MPRADFGNSRPRAGLTRRCRCVRFVTMCAIVGLASPVRAQNGATVTGVVRSTAGDPLGGVSVSIDALGIATLTRENGQYAFTVSSAQATGQTKDVRFRALGRKPATRSVTLGTQPIVLDVVLETNPLQLGEIVVTGEGTTSQVEKLASARSNIDSALIQKSNESNLVNALAAKAPNVQVTSNAGDPGASTSIQIRGPNTLNGSSDPLFVVDGVPYDNTTIPTAQFDGTGFGGQEGTATSNRAIDLDPDDVASIEILKGAAAGAVFGARAGQGVILVTTKKGAGGATRYRLNSSASVNNVTRFLPLQRQFAQGDNGSADACAQSAMNATPTLDCTATVRSWGPELCPTITCPGTFDHSRETFRTGLTTDNALSIAGGSERTDFYLSAAYLDQSGTFVGPNNNLTRSAVRLRGDEAVTPRLRIGGNAAYAATEGNFVQRGNSFSGVLIADWSSAPTFDNLPYLAPRTGEHRSYTFPNPSVASTALGRTYDNPLFDAYADVGNSITDRTTGSTNVDWTPIDWLRVAHTLGIDHYNDNRLQGQAQTSSNTLSPLGQVVKVDLANTQVDHNLVATATWERNADLGGTVALGQNLNSRSTSQFGAVGNGLIAPSPFTLANTISQPPPTELDSKVRTDGYFVQSTLDLAQQLFLKAGIRNDGVSTFAANARRRWFPSLSGAWEFTKLLHGTGLGPISYGKLRSAYGEVGTQPPPYLSSVIFTTGRIGDGGAVNIPPGGVFTPSTEPARDLRPERTREFEAGTDLGLFGNAADVGVTWYDRDSRDVILPVPVPLSTGYLQQYENGARIRNIGTELTLNLRPITKRTFSWDVGVAFGTNRNRVLSLQGAQFVPYGGPGGFGEAVAQVGEPIGAFRTFDYVRCGRGIILAAANGSDYSVDAHCSAAQDKQHALFLTDGTLSIGGDLGAGKGYPLKDPTSRILGSPQPDWTGSVRSGIHIGHLALSGLVDIRHGGTILNATRGGLIDVGTSVESARRGQTVVMGKNFLNGPVAGPGVGTPVQLTEGFMLNYYDFYANISAPFLESASFVKLREISATWTLIGDPVSRALHLSSIDLRVSGRNIVTWTGYTGVDPEVNLAGAETGARNIDYFSNPQTRSIVLTVALNR